jgi:Ti-type conjugative transfer relaxase TraA
VAIYHFTTKIISRSGGRSIVRAAAYRSASCLFDQRIGVHYNYERKAGVIHTEILLPQGAPAKLADRELLWNKVEMFEKRMDAQLGREVEFALPRELSQADNIKLAQDFVQREFVARGMIADLCIHWDIGADGQPKPHAHVLLTMRGVIHGEFGPKRRQWLMAADGKTYLLDAQGKRIPDWNNKALLYTWRERWAGHVNAWLAERGFDARIDHRSFVDQGITLEPERKINGMTERLLDDGLPDDIEIDEAHQLGPNGARAVNIVARHARNIERLQTNPAIILDLITRTQSTFTERDLQRALHRYTALAISHEEFQTLYAKARHHRDLIALGRDGRGEARFSTRAMIEIEEQMERLAQLLSTERRHEAQAPPSRSIAHLGQDQRRALHHILQGGDLTAVIGLAGSGKTTLLASVREAYEAQGYRVQGAALAGIAAENLEQGTGIESRTIASLTKRWRDGRHPLTAQDVLIVDEAGMVGSRDMNALLFEAERAGAKVILVGDARQLQAIAAGAAFRTIVERIGAARLDVVRRQKDDWRKAATRQLEAGLVSEALDQFRRHGAIKAYGTTEMAKEALLNAWTTEVRPDQTSVLMAHRRDDVRDLNTKARERLRAAHRLGPDQTVELKRKRTDDEGQEVEEMVTRTFAIGDRVLFTRNEQSLGVKNGTLGTIRALERGQFRVLLDTGAEVTFAAHMYGNLEHGYALTIHKNQGATVDRAFVLAADTFDQHLAYVALTRDRAGVTLAYGRDQIPYDDELDRIFKRERTKDSVLDYRGIYATRRGINAQTDFAENEIGPIKVRPTEIKVEPLLRGPAPALKPPVTIQLPPTEYVPQPKRPSVTPLGPVKAKEPIKPAPGEPSQSPGASMSDHLPGFEVWKAKRDAKKARSKERARHRSWDRER